MLWPTVRTFLNCVYTQTFSELYLILYEYMFFGFFNQLADKLPYTAFALIDGSKYII